MVIFLSLLAAVIPTILYVVLLWRSDRFDREPFRDVLITFLYGGIGVIVIAIIATVSINWLVSVRFALIPKDSSLETMLIAPIIEETLKGVFLIIALRKRPFDSYLDGFVYGAAAGFGFAMTENFLYFVAGSQSASGWVTIVIIRSLFSATMHGIATGFFGLCYAVYKFGTFRLRWSFPAIGWTVAIIIHAGWNTGVSSEDTVLLSFLFVIAAVLLSVAVFRALLKNEEKIIFRELQEEAELGLIPAAHPGIMSTHLRHREGWMHPGTRELYVRTATKLAFSKHALRHPSVTRREILEQEVMYYRNKVHSLISDQYSQEEYHNG